MTMLASWSRLCFVPLILLAAAGGQSAPVPGQVPRSVGFSLPTLQGSLAYSLSAAENLNFGYNGSSAVASFTGVSGNLAYLSASVTHPASVIYAGGYLANSTGQPGSLFQNLALSQEVDTRNWKFLAADVVDYLPETAISGLSGVPGLGDVGLPPVGSGVDGQGVLSNYSNRVDNDVHVTATRAITGSTSFGGSGRFNLERFVGMNSDRGFDNNQYTGIGGLSHRIDALNSISARYSFSRFTYLTTPVTFDVQGIELGYLRQWSRSFAMDVSLTPQKITAAQSKGSQYDFAADASLTYADVRSSASLVYLRSVNNGAGVLPGVRTDSVALTGQRRFTREWSGAASVSYLRTSSLTILTTRPFNAQGQVASVQVNRAFSPGLSAYISYTAQHQSTQEAVISPGLFSGLSQIVGVGITYAPGAKQFRRR